MPTQKRLKAIFVNKESVTNPGQLQGHSNFREYKIQDKKFTLQMFR